MGQCYGSYSLSIKLHWYDMFFSRMLAYSQDFAQPGSASGMRDPLENLPLYAAPRIQLTLYFFSYLLDACEF
jgi:hypothetical protein